MAKIIIEIEDMPEGTYIKFKGDLPAADAKDKTGAQQTAVLISKMIQAAQLISKMIQAAQMMASTIRKH
ncbi:hypothetical protein [Neisseria maigaei]|uniref:hypothetical protein n=1 Tax=Neisseria maigaei TaxID=2830651 RepID=UPI00265A2286|nr:hypothetical protein [Neisseria maigaei]